ncbi:penicillin-binding transpeptidase domain-containing protein [Clostridium botulinum]|uniref:penicillin-binding transpeptidase domain-containing protein n=1 Tax=Clostridium botulinum TaxID=1491 RepID=UPI000A531557|nr:penicillin-binding transpeptidase domain-containing protein [Clostridium botulinum]QPW59860.1 penicillin-binding protein [Clostridium botulinum]
MIRKFRRRKNLITKRKNNKFDRYVALTVVMIFIFSMILTRLAYLQVVKADEYRELTSKKSIRNIPITPPRGNIIDSKGKVLAESSQGYTLTFTETDESKENFFPTMLKVFKILEENGEVQQDAFELKINPVRFEFNTDNEKARKAIELRFKKDRGMDEKVAKELFKDKKPEELTDEDKAKINEPLLKKTPEETFNYLLDLYKINDEETKEIYTELFNKIRKEPNGESRFSEYLKTYDVKGKNQKEQYNQLYKSMHKENVFDQLVKSYKINTKRFSLEEKRKFMVVKDAIKLQSFYSFKPVVIASNIKRNTAFVFMQQYEDLPGIEVTVEPIRVYPYNEVGSGFLGYLSKINSSQKEKYEEKGYDPSSDYIGSDGIESAFESTLRGSKGTKIVQINKYGRIMRELGRKEPYPGKTVQLTIDTELQNTTEQSLKEGMRMLQSQGRHGDVDTTNATRGAAVVIDIKTGKVLAMASEPGFDPNYFAVPGKLTPELQKQFFQPDLAAFGKEYVTKLLRRSYEANQTYSGKSIDEIVDILFPLDKSIANNKTIRQDYYDLYPKPLYNYATSTLAPPGSTFKPLTAVAGLEENAIEPYETFDCPSVFTKNKYNGKNFLGKPYSGVSVTKALEQSINYFFFEVGDRLYKQKKYNDGFDALAHYAWKFGLGAPKDVKPATGIEINEKFGQVYNLESGRKIFSSLYMNSLVDLLSRGTDTRSPNYRVHYIGININNASGDSKEVETIKSNLRNEIVEEIKYKKNGIVNIKNMLVELSKKDPKLKEKYDSGYNEYTNKYSGDQRKKMSREKYISDQIEQATLAISYSIDDGNFNINNQNNVYDASIGQGTNQFTPVQMVNYIATLVNGGNRYKVHLVDSILDQDGNKVKEFKPEVIEKVNLKQSTIDIVKAGMRDVVNEGTAKGYLKSFPISNGAKTGSATISTKLQDLIGRSSYGVFIGFAPFDNPEIAVCTIVFDGGHGGESGGVVARAVYEQYFKERLQKESPGYKPMFNYELKSNKENADIKKDDADKNVASNNESQPASNVQKKENEQPQNQSETKNDGQ